MIQALTALVVAAATGLAPSAPAPVSSVDRSPELEAALVRAGDRRAEWEALVDGAPEELRDELAFVVAFMPTQDLASLDPKFVGEDVRLATEAFESAPWRESVPREVFEDAVLPYANADEAREAWRERLRAVALPMVEGCTTPGEAAQALNRKLFAELGVKYSTKRNRANQAPSETIETGLASCTGLSILLVDACRSVGVPARLAGIGAWPHKDGNHTWVEVWDGERWRFTGAAEYDAAGLDRAWFTGDAKEAVAGDPLHAVMAVAWRETGKSFHLPWDPRATWVHGVDATSRYAIEQKDDGTVSVWLRAWKGGRRVRAEVQCLSPESGGHHSWSPVVTNGEDADLNDMPEFAIPRGSSVVLVATYGEDGRAESFDDLSADTTVDFDFDEARQDVASDPASARTAAWARFLASDEHADLRADHEARRVQTSDRVSPYTLKTVGEVADGARWPLVIAMHGGGGAPQELNDSQWQHMQIYYKDHPEAGGYKYLALRAPNNEWNGVYDDAIVPLIDKLVRQMVVCENVDPSRVVILGYSHGGYGAFVIGPKAPDRFAAIHSSAAAATDGETELANLMNANFSFMVGGEDRAYGRRERCEKAAATLAELREKYAGEDLYPFEFTLVEGNGHGGLPDRDILPKLLAKRRDAAPKRIAWRLTDDRITDFYWLRTDAPKSGASVDAHITSPNTIEITVSGLDSISLMLDERHVDPTKPLTVRINGTERTFDLEPSAEVLLETLWRRADPELSATMRVDVEVPKQEREGK
ncbi:MAG: transglutaminase domain-containing protein [Planctomycetota bacterium]